MKDAGIVIRSIPYSDNARILQCFTESHGLLSVYHRISSKRIAGHLQQGSFLHFTTKEKSNGGLLTLSDSRWNPHIPTDPLSGQAGILWMLAVELVQKSLKERLILPSLYHRLSSYYASLTQHAVVLDPLIPLVIVSHDLGLCDVEVVFSMADKESLLALQLLGIGRGLDVNRPSRNHEGIFNIEMERFREHFGIDHIGALELLA